MKKIIVLLILLLSLVGFSSAQTSLMNGIATGDNVKMDFNDSHSSVGVVIDSFSNDVCNTGKKGFLLTGSVNREGNGYVYFTEDDGDNTVNTCVAVILSGKNFVLTGVGATDSGVGYNMKFNNIDLVYDKSKKAFYFDGEAVDSALGTVSNWNSAYITGLNLIDWNETIVDYSKFTDGNYIANGTNKTIDIVLKDVGGNEVNILDTIDVELVSTSSDLTNLVYLKENKGKKVTLSIINGIVKVPVYILKSINSGKFKLRFSYEISDMDGNTSHDIEFKNIKTKEPIKDITLSLPSVSVVGEEFTGNMDIVYENKGKINSVSITGDTNIDANYNLDLLSSTDTSFKGKIYPKDKNNTKSVIDAIYKVKSYTIGFSNFSGINVKYNITKNLNFKSYANKKVDLSKSFKGLNLTTEFTGGDITNTLSFKPILRDKNDYRIPDVKYDLKMKDMGIANSYTGWDCNEIDAGYQKNCKALQFIKNGNIYRGNIDNVLGTKFSYDVTDSDYQDVKVVSYKPITGGNLKFDITNLENISSNWNFTNSGDWLKLPSNYNGKIRNINFRPFIDVRLVGLDEEENYVDINNNIFLKLNNISTNDISDLDYDLTGEITKPTSGVSFSEGEELTGENITISSNNKELSEESILFALTYGFDEEIKFNYNHGYYSYNLSNGVGNLKLRPWTFYFNLGGTYKIGGSYVNGLISKTQKYTSSVKNSIGRTTNSISVRFSSAYNRLRKKANYLTQGVLPESNSVIKPTDFKGGVKYYKCSSGSEKVYVNTGTYLGNNTIVLSNCKLIIRGNIYKGNDKSSLVFFLYDDKQLSLENMNYLDRTSNIYITENVSDIEAGLFAKGSIFTVNESDIDNGVYISNRTHSINKKQLYIQGSLMAKNNVGGAFLIAGEEKFTIGGSKKIYKTDGLWGQITTSNLRNIAQVFDINFLRGFKYSGANTIDPNWYSSYCDKGNKKDSGCKYPVYIQFDSNLKHNKLFR